MPRQRVVWKYKNELLRLHERTLLMGVVSLDAPALSDPDRAYERVAVLADQGAGLIELCADPWKGGAAPVDAEVEIRRLVPVLKRAFEQPLPPICVRTSKLEVAERVLGMGVQAIHDPSGLTFEPDLAKAVANADAGLLLSHLRGVPESWPKMGTPKNIVEMVRDELAAAVSRAVRAGVMKDRIALSPGLGQGKRKEQHSELIAHIYELAKLKTPLFLHPAGEAFVTEPASDPSEAMAIAAAVAAILNGAHIVAFPDLGGVRSALHTADGFLAARETEKSAAESSPAPAIRPRAPEPPPEPRRRPVRPPVR